MRRKWPACFMWLHELDSCVCCFQTEVSTYQVASGLYLGILWTYRIVSLCLGQIWFLVLKQ